MLRYGNNLIETSKNTKILWKIIGAEHFLQSWFFCFALAANIDVFWLISADMYPFASTAEPPDTEGSNTSWIGLWRREPLLQGEVGFWASAGVWKCTHPTGLGPDVPRGPHLVHHLGLHWYLSPDAVGGVSGGPRIVGLQSPVG